MDNKLIYTLKKSKRARRISITVKHAGEVIVTMPMRVPEFVARTFVTTKTAWILAMQEKLKKRFENKTVLKQNRTDYLQHKEEAREFVKARVEYFNTFYKFKIGDIRIKNLASRWGSCSGKGNLNFNYSIYRLPQELADYIVVHELCHLKELNHSARFWNLVGEVVPNYKTLRQKLKKDFIHIL